jgi:hypothetical protein
MVTLVGIPLPALVVMSGRAWNRLYRSLAALASATSKLRCGDALNYGLRRLRRRHRHGGRGVRPYPAQIPGQGALGVKPGARLNISVTPRCPRPDSIGPAVTTTWPVEHGGGVGSACSVAGTAMAVAAVAAIAASIVIFMAAYFWSG